MTTIRYHKLPSLAYQGYNDSCTKSTDCAIGLVCFKQEQVYWLSEEMKGEVQFLRHDDIQGSNNYTLGNPLSIAGFCSCDRTFAWTGYDCTDYDSSWYFEVAILFLFAMICFSVSGFSIYLIQYRRIELKKRTCKDMVAKSLIPLVFSTLSAGLSASFRIRETISPRDYEFVPDPNGERYIRYGKAFVVFNCGAAFFTTISLFHIQLNWMYLAEKMNLKTKVLKTKTLMYILVGLEIIWTFAVFGCIILGVPQYVFVFTTLYTVIIGMISIYSMQRLNGLIREITQNVSGMTSEAKNETEGLRDSIFYCALRTLIVCVLYIVYIIIFVVYLLVLGVVDQTQTPEGNFNRPYMYIIYFAVYVTTISFALTIQRYVYSLTFSHRRCVLTKASNGENKETLHNVVSSKPENQKQAVSGKSVDEEIKIEKKNPNLAMSLETGSAAALSLV